MSQTRTLDKGNIRDITALTPMQEGILFHYLRDPGGRAYFEQLSLQLEGHIHRDFFRQAWNKVVETNEMLRTLFRWEKVAAPVQISLKEHHLLPIYLDITGQYTPGGEDWKGAVEKIKRKDRLDTFDLRDVPFRVTLCRVREGLHVLLISSHHILFDGWSNGILLKEFFQAYLALSGGNPWTVPSKPPFSQFVKGLQKTGIDNTKTFWHEYLEGFDSPAQFPLKDTGSTAGGGMEHHRERLPGEPLEAFCKQQKITPAALLYGSWGLLLQAYQDSPDVIFGTTVSGRSGAGAGVEECVGLFINTVPLRVTAQEDETSGGFLARVHAGLQSRQPFENSSLVDIKTCSALAAGEELFDTLVVIENYPLEKSLAKNEGPLVIRDYGMVEETHYDFTLVIKLFDEVEINFHYRGGCFQPGSIERLAGHFLRILRAQLDEPARLTGHIDFLPEEEKQQILVRFNDTRAPYPAEQTLHGLFEAQAGKTPDRTALVGRWASASSAGETGDTAEPVELTYRQSDLLATRLSRRLAAMGAGPGAIVALTAERSLDMVLSLLAILKTGAAYLPIIPGYPQERKGYLLADSSARMLLSALPGRETTGETAGARWNGVTADVCPLLASFSPDDEVGPVPPVSTEAGHDRLAYIIYTSGSTGRPKGVMVEHRAVLNTLWAMQEAYPLGPEDAYLFKTTYAFDVSVAELFGWYLGGGRLALLEPGAEKDPETIAAAIRQHRVTHVNFVPSMFGVFLDALTPGTVDRLSSLKYIFLAGEALPSRQVSVFQSLGLNKHIRLENIYGPTEASIYASWYSTGDAADAGPGGGSIPIGKPLPNTGLYILDSSGRPQPLGVPGELCIGGAGLARGYLNRPQLTAERFAGLEGRGERGEGSKDKSGAPAPTRVEGPTSPNIQYSSPDQQEPEGPLFSLPSPLSPLPSRLYHSGDLARWLPDGNIRFLGRIDHQVKVRGFRIEPGEIESLLLEHSSMKEAVVTALEDAAGDTRIIAYTVSLPAAGEGEQELIATVREYLTQRVPDYMVPSVFIPLERLPMTPSGKPDRKALPLPSRETFAPRAMYAPPRDDTDTRLLEAWSRMLGIEPGTIGIDDNFFHLGGHSLKAVRLCGRIHKSFDIQLPLPEFFRRPTIRAQAEFLKHAARARFHAIPAVPKQDRYPLSSAQKRLHLLQQRDPESTAYNMTGFLAIRGELDKERMEAAFHQLNLRHESLRTSIHQGGGEPYQVIHEAAAPDLQYSGFREPCSFDEAIAAFVRPFDLARPPLVRVGLCKAPQHSYLLMVDMHHIVSDGMSIEVLTREFTALYSGEPPPPLRIQYKDFAQWQNRRFLSDTFQVPRDYWFSRFPPGAALPRLEIPTDFPRPERKSYRGAVWHDLLDAPPLEALRQVTRDLELTAFMALLAALNLLLAKIGGAEDIVVGTPVAGRNHGDLEGIIGMFVNTLALRTAPAGTRSVADYAAEVKQTCIRAFEHQEYPFEQLVEQTGAGGDLGRNPIFDVMLALQNQESGALRIPGLQLEPYRYDSPVSKFDISLSAAETPRGLELAFSYSTDLFEEETIVRYAGCLRRIITAMAGDPRRALGTLEIISQEEKQLILEVFNDTAVPYPRDKTLHQLFEEQAARFPDGPACTGPCLGHPWAGDRVTLTYRQLKEDSDRLALLLPAREVGPGRIAALLFQRSVEMVIGILAVLKTGGAYLPIEPEYPEGRVAYMLEDSGAQLLLINHDNEDYAFHQLPETVETLDIRDALREPPVPGNLPALHSPSEPAYIIYTSGTTGRPKGVLIEHRNAVNVTWWWGTTYRLRPGTPVLQMSNYTFDPSVNQFFGTLSQGASLHLVHKETLQDLEELRSFIDTRQIYLLNFVPLVLAGLLGEGPPLKSVRVVLSGGESLNETVKNTILSRGYPLYNQYGPTEATIDALVEECRPDRPVTLGPPISNTRCYILDKDNRPAPIGIPGEICIAGDGLARGYLNDPQRTAEKFQPNPIPSLHSLIYRTGDIGKWEKGGNVRFMGRRDQQVKIRGFRIELEEIERILTAIDEIKEAVVLARDIAELREDSAPSPEDTRYLCGYIVADIPIDIPDLQEYLAMELPDYMVPPTFVQLDRIPRTPAGKIDRLALPLPEIAESYAAPENETEETVAGIWGEVLGIDKNNIGVNANFFELGGHSLKVTIVASKIHHHFGIKIPLHEMYERLTVRQTAQYIEENIRETYVSITPAEEKPYYRLSSSQKRLFFLQEMEPGAVNYNMPGSFLLEGNLDTGKLEQAIEALVHRHESFRTSFHIVDGEPMQQVHASTGFQVEHHQLEAPGSPGETAPGTDPVRARRAEIDAVVKDFPRSFDLSQPPLLRAGLLRVAPTRHILMIDMHHIISDGASIYIFVSEFNRLYTGESLEPLPIQYKDYAEWHRRRAREGERGAREAYWLGRFRGEIPVLNLPTDFPRPQVQRFEGSTLQFKCSPAETRGLKEFAASEEATPFMALYAAFGILLSKLGGQEDIIIGTPIAGRQKEEVQNIIGMFVNTLVLRCRPQAPITLRRFLGAVRQDTLDAFANQDYQFEDLVEKTAVKRDTSRNPIFDVLVSLENMDIAPLRLPDLKVREYDFESNNSRFDMALDCFEWRDELHCYLEYSTNLFKPATIERFSRYFTQIVGAFGDDWNRPIRDIDMIPAPEKQRLLETFNDTRAPYPSHQTAHELFAQQAGRTPRHTAVRFHQQELTYRQLDNRAHATALELRARGIGKGAIVAIMADRSQEMPVHLLAVLKSGAAYLPLEPDFPEERIKFMLRDSAAAALICRENHNPLAAGICGVINPGPLEYGDQVPAPIEPAAGPGDTCYVIFTSGSTGRPKGVMVDHRPLVNFISAMQRLIQFRETDVVLSLTIMSFDIFGLETLVPLCAGSRVVIGDTEARMNPAATAEVLEQEAVTILQATPTRWNMLAADTGARRSLTGLRAFLVGGEAFPPALLETLRQLSPDRIINLYGPTETTIWSTARDVTRGELNIGKPVINTGIYILDKHRRLQPTGVTGELCIGGDGLARGYLNRPQLTAQQFIPNPFSASTTLIYRTGDLARWLPDGNIECLGRVDHQVKIRGYRIELEEIERLLGAHESIEETVVTAVAAGGEDGAAGEPNTLCAYYVSTQTLNPGDLRTLLANKLPHYMVPAYFMPVEEIPLTPSGKVDRNALPNPVSQWSGREYAAPRGPMEAALAEIWAEILHTPIKDIGIDDNFFEIGGHSLIAINMVAQVHKILKVRLPLVEIFKKPTIRGMTQYIESSGRGKFPPIEPAEPREHYPLSSSQKRMYIAQMMEPEGISYNMSLVLQLEGELDVRQLEDTFNQILQRHESLRTSFRDPGDGPVQTVHSAEDSPLEIHYYEAGEDRARETAARFIRPFDLSSPPLIRAGLITLGPRRHILMADMHHIVSDGQSMERLQTEFITLYSGGKLPPPTLQYKDFALWQEQVMQSQAFKDQETYWLDQFKGEIPVLNVPTDFPRPQVRNVRKGDLVIHMLKEDAAATVYQFSRDNGVTLYMLLAAVYSILLFKYSGQQDIVTATPITGRSHPDLQTVIGVFLNMLPMRHHPRPDQTAAQFIAEVKAVTTAAYDNQDYQFDQLVQKLGVQGDPSRNPIMDAEFALLYRDAQTGDIPGLKVKPYGEGAMFAKFDLHMVATETAGGIELVLRYSTELFKKSTAANMLNHYVEILEQVIKQKDTRLEDISISLDISGATSTLFEESAGDDDFEL